MANNPCCQFLAVTLLPTCLLFLFPWLPLRRGPVLWQPTTFQPCRGAQASLLIVKTLSRQPLPSTSSAKKTLAKLGKHLPLHSALLDVNHLLHVLLFLDAVDHLIARPRTSHMSEMCTKLKAPKFETTTIWLRNLSISIGDVLNQEWCNPLSVHSRQGHSGKWKRKREKERKRKMEISRIFLWKFANFQFPKFQHH